MKIRPAETNDLSKALPVAQTIAALRARAEAAEKERDDALIKLSEERQSVDIACSAAAKALDRAEAAEKERDEHRDNSAMWQRDANGAQLRAEASEAELKMLREAVRHHCDICDSSFSKVAALRNILPEDTR